MSLVEELHYRLPAGVAPRVPVREQSPSATTASDTSPRSSRAPRCPTRRLVSRRAARGRAGAAGLPARRRVAWGAARAIGAASRARVRRAASSPVRGLARSGALVAVADLGEHERASATTMAAPSTPPESVARLRGARRVAPVHVVLRSTHTTAIVTRSPRPARLGDWHPPRSGYARRGLSAATITSR